MNKTFQKVLNVLGSRTVQVLVLVVATNAVNLYSDVFTQEQLTFLTTVLSALAVYFRVNPQAKFK